MKTSFVINKRDDITGLNYLEARFYLEHGEVLLAMEETGEAKRAYMLKDNKLLRFKVRSTEGTCLRISSPTIVKSMELFDISGKFSIYQICNTRHMSYQGEDDWHRPIYECLETGELWKDIDLGKLDIPSLYSAYDIDGEPECLIQKGLEVIMMKDKEATLIFTTGR